MNKNLILFGVFIVALLVSGENCLLEEKVIDVVIKEETCAEFAENSTSETFATSVEIDYADQIDQILSDNGYSKSDIKSATLESGSYGVTSYTGTTDWIISGGITVRRVDGGGSAVTLLDYTSESVVGLLGQKKDAALTSAGVALLNDALADYLGGQEPVIEFTVNNGDVNPNPSQGDPIVFNWRACLRINVVIEQTVDVPEPPL